MIVTYKTRHSSRLSFRPHSVERGAAPRVSFVVSKKVAKNAVDRNRLKRRGRAIVRDIEKSTNTCHSGIFYFKKGANALSFQEIKAEIEHLL